MKQQITAARTYREKLLADPHRPAFHFTVPDDNGMPGDPNGAFFADGVYHLMYLYRNSGTEAFHWGHISSRDLLHWRHHPDALLTNEGDQGCFSGGAFVDDDGTAYLSFWKFPSADGRKDNGGIALACARPPYDVWERMEPIAVEGTEWGIRDVELEGQTVHLGCADPSNIWKMNGFYYMQLGALCVLNKYGREENSPPEYQGDWTELFRSRDLKHWEFVHRFYTNTHAGEDWPDHTEDDMCPSFLPLYDAPAGGNFTGKWLQLFISHNKGCQYYIGTLDEAAETFLPEVHGRMSWQDNTCFAPEALVDGNNRQILWTWLHDNPENDFETYGWAGVYSFPRVVWLQDGELHMAPAEELAQLQYNHQIFDVPTAGRIPVKNGLLCRLKAQWHAADTDGAGLCVRVSSDGSEYTAIFYDHAAGKLVMDTTRSGCDGRRIREEAPFCLKEGEELSLDLFIDRSVIEVYANQRQALCRRVYPTAPAEADGICLAPGAAAPCTLEAWELDAANPY